MRVPRSSIAPLCLGLVLIVLFFFWGPERVDPALEFGDQPDPVFQSKEDPLPEPEPTKVDESKASRESVKAIRKESEPKLADAPRPQKREEPNRARLLTATLLPSNNIFPEMAKIGIGRISQQDYRDFMEEQNEDAAGPRDLFELAGFTEWIDAALSPKGSGQWTIDPIEVPSADLYRIFAWGARGYFLYDFIPFDKDWVGERSAGSIWSTPFTGLDILLKNHGGKPYYLTFQRNPTPKGNEEDSAIGSAIGLIAPSLKQAYSGRPVEISQGGEVFTPMYPDPTVQLRLLTKAGTLSEPITVPLNQNQVRTITLDIDELFERERPPIDLTGRLVFSTGKPVAQGVIERRGSFRQSRITSEDGLFSFDDLSADGTTRFRVTIPRPSEGRPIAGSQHRFVFDPVGVEGRTANVEWVIPAFRWLVLGVTEEDRTNINAERPYPVYLLQMEESGVWKDMPAEEFFPQEDGMAISLTRVGAFRGVVAFSPVHYAYSKPVTITPNDHEVYIPMNLERTERPVTYTIRFVDGEVPVSAPIRIIGGHTSLPPLEITVAQTGLRLAVSSKVLFITVAGEEHEVHLENVKGFEIIINIGPAPE